MAKWIFLGTPCLTCLVFLFSAALSRQIRPASAAAHVPRSSQFVSAAQPDKGDMLDGPRLLDQACAALRSARWFKATIWQRMQSDSSSFESEAILVLGPNHCARMEMNVRTQAQSCRILMVSDGRTLAEATSLPGEPDKVAARQLPAAEAVVQRDVFLRRHGCAGLLPLMLELKANKTVWHAEAGFMRNMRVVRLTGNLESIPAPTSPPGASSAGQVRIYFDAASLLPVRLEWSTGADPARSPMLLEMEYRGLELNRAMSQEECAHAFTFDKRK